MGKSPKCQKCGEEVEWSYYHGCWMGRRRKTCECPRGGQHQSSY